MSKTRKREQSRFVIEINEGVGWKSFREIEKPLAKALTICYDTEVEYNDDTCDGERPAVFRLKRVSKDKVNS